MSTYFYPKSESANVSKFFYSTRSFRNNLILVFLAVKSHVFFFTFWDIFLSLDPPRNEWNDRSPDEKSIRISSEKFLLRTTSVWTVHENRMRLDFLLLGPPNSLPPLEIKSGLPSRFAARSMRGRQKTEHSWDNTKCKKDRKWPNFFSQNCWSFFLIWIQFGSDQLFSLFSKHECSFLLTV